MYIETEKILFVAIALQALGMLLMFHMILDHSKRIESIRKAVLESLTYMGTLADSQKKLAYSLCELDDLSTRQTVMKAKLDKLWNDQLDVLSNEEEEIIESSVDES